MKYATLREEIVHGLIHPFGQTLRRVNPRAYEIVRWEVARWKPMRSIIPQPMSQHLLLPFFVRKGDTVVDVGANTGQFSVPLARLVGPGGVVHAFEPILPTFEELREVVRREKVESRVVLNRLALGESARTVSFTIPRNRPTEATSVPHDRESWGDFHSQPGNYATETCEMVALDEYLKRRGIGEVSFLKCDVEGGELQVLRGARQLLRSARPPVLMLEAFEGWTKSFGYHPRDLFRFLRDEAGYESYWICGSGLKRVRPEDGQIPGIFWQWVDFLCLVPDHHQKKVGLERYLA